MQGLIFIIDDIYSSLYSTCSSAVHLCSLFNTVWVLRSKEWSKWPASVNGREHVGARGRDAACVARKRGTAQATK